MSRMKSELIGLKRQFYELERREKEMSEKAKENEAMMKKIGVHKTMYKIRKEKRASECNLKIK